MAALRWRLRHTASEETAMGRYHHLTLDEREDIMCLRAEGKGVREIARRLGRDAATVSRELSRNDCAASARRPSAYRASIAQRRYLRRRGLCKRRRRLADPALRSLVTSLIVERRWSPEQIAGRVLLEGVSPVSAPTIRRAIRRGELDTPRLRLEGVRVRSRLRRHGKKPRRAGDRRGEIPVPHELAERPQEAAERVRLGDWEADTVVGRRGAGPCLVTLVDRRSGYLAGGLAPAHTKDDVADVEIRALTGLPAHTVTPDRGKEFAAWARVGKATGAEFYLCAAHHPWEKGCVENLNGLLREYFPKGTDLSKVGDGDVQAVYDELNHRPRKRLGWRTPWEVFHSEVLHLL